MQTTQKKRLLLHVCCANCMMHPHSELKDKYDVTFFFFNPNIYPRGEYLKRLKEVKRAARVCGVSLVSGRYEHKKWMKKTAGLENEPEGGKRCARCFEIRFEETARYAKTNGFDIFASTLSVSPHKNAKTVNDTGAGLAEKCGISYLLSDFKKNEGFKKSMKLAGELDIYRQNYCGCIFSMGRISR
jgi:predicted adenine nucleotide alpha hydrolase (AANH) superfamily ATPase